MARSLPARKGGGEIRRARDKTLESDSRVGWSCGEIGVRREPFPRPRREVHHPLWARLSEFGRHAPSSAERRPRRRGRRQRGRRGGAVGNPRGKGEQRSRGYSARPSAGPDGAPARRQWEAPSFLPTEGRRQQQQQQPQQEPEAQRQQQQQQPTAAAARTTTASDNNKSSNNSSLRRFLQQKPRAEQLCSSVTVPAPAKGAFCARQWFGQPVEDFAAPPISPPPPELAAIIALPGVQEFVTRVHLSVPGGMSNADLRVAVKERSRRKEISRQLARLQVVLDGRAQFLERSPCR